MDQDDIWYGGLGRGNLVLDGNPAHSSPTPEFSAHVCCGQTAGLIRMPLHTEIGLVLGHIVLDGDPVPQKWGHRAPCKFSTHVCCGQTAGWIKMLLGMEVSQATLC